MVHFKLRPKDNTELTVEAIKEAIAELPDDDGSCLAAWLNGLDYDDWEK